MSFGPRITALLDWLLPRSPVIAPPSIIFDDRRKGDETWELTLCREVVEYFELMPWKPRFEIPHRRVVLAAEFQALL